MRCPCPGSVVRPSRQVIEGAGCPALNGCPKGTGWFAVGYGAFRRLTRSSQIIIPALEQQARFTNFVTLFHEDEPLSAFERWMVYLDYRISKAGDADAQKKKALRVEAINQLLPRGTTFERVTEEGRICFNVHGVSVPTIALSDGYRSVLALAGDLVWRLMLAFPESPNPFREEGIVLIDELDIHLHPLWQRHIARWLQDKFPALQFVVATHSPFIAVGAGSEALTLKFAIQNGKSIVETVPDIAAMNVDRVLQSAAFGLMSTYAPQTQEKIDRYDSLARKGPQKSAQEDSEFRQLSMFMQEARPFGGPPAAGSLEARIEQYLQETLP